MKKRIFAYFFDLLHILKFSILTQILTLVVGKFANIPFEQMMDMTTLLISTIFVAYWPLSHLVRPSTRGMNRYGLAFAKNNGQSTRWYEIALRQMPTVALAGVMIPHHLLVLLNPTSKQLVEITYQIALYGLLIALVDRLFVCFRKDRRSLFDLILKSRIIENAQARSS